MTEWLWTGESTYCKCGHHVTSHHTLVGYATGKRYLKCTPLGHRHCRCKGFQAYRLLEGTSVEVEKFEEDVISR